MTNEAQSFAPSLDQKAIPLNNPPKTLNPQPFTLGHRGVARDFRTSLSITLLQSRYSRQFPDSARLHAATLDIRLALKLSSVHQFESSNSICFFNTTHPLAIGAHMLKKLQCLSRNPSKLPGFLTQVSYYLDTLLGVAQRTSRSFHNTS